MPVIVFFDEMDSIFRTRGAGPKATLDGAFVRTEQAAVLDARADAIEGALMDAARDAVHWPEQHAAYTRTGYHSAVTGDSAGACSSLRFRLTRRAEAAQDGLTAGSRRR